MPESAFARNDLFNTTVHLTLNSHLCVCHKCFHLIKFYMEQFLFCIKEMSPVFPVFHTEVTVSIGLKYELA